MGIVTRRSPDCRAKGPRSETAGTDRDSPAYLPLCDDQGVDRPCPKPRTADPGCAGGCCSAHESVMSGEAILTPAGVPGSPGPIPSSPCSCAIHRPPPLSGKTRSLIPLPHAAKARHSGGELRHLQSVSVHHSRDIKINVELTLIAVAGNFGQAASKPSLHTGGTGEGQGNSLPTLLRVGQLDRHIPW